jgi:fructose-specific phosphotransferase system IIC component
LYLYLPASRKSLRGYGACGMAMRAALRAGAFRAWVAVDPAPLLSLLGVTAGILVTCLYGPLAGAVVCILAWIPIIARHSVPFLAVCPVLPLHLIVGFLRFKSKPVLYQDGETNLCQETGIAR